MIHTNIEHAENLGPAELENLETLDDLRLEELFAMSGEPIDKSSEEHLDYFVERVELVKLDDLSVPNGKDILKNTFERYSNCPLVEVERNTFYTSNGIPSWLLMRRSPFLFRDVLITPGNNFALLFESGMSSAYKSIPYSSQFGVISEGSYFVTKREFNGVFLQSELFYVPLIGG